MIGFEIAVFLVFLAQSLECSICLINIGACSQADKKLRSGIYIAPFLESMYAVQFSCKGGHRYKLGEGKTGNCVQVFNNAAYRGADSIIVGDGLSHYGGG